MRLSGPAPVLSSSRHPCPSRPGRGVGSVKFTTTPTAQWSEISQFDLNGPNRRLLNIKERYVRCCDTDQRAEEFKDIINLIHEAGEEQEGETYDYLMLERTDPLTFYNDIEFKDAFCLSKANKLLERL